MFIELGKRSEPWEEADGSPFMAALTPKKKPISSWEVRLASAACLGGPWQRCSDLNPLLIKNRFIENPVVTRLEDGTYVAAYDTDVNYPRVIGHSFSRDGIQRRGRQLFIEPDSQKG